MNKKLLTLLLAAGIAVIFVATGLQAGTKVEDTLTMDTKGYSHKKKAPPKYNLVQFSHKKHNADYKISCGECHHDEKNQPLDLKIGDDVKPCGECHNIFKKDKENAKNILVHENAIHGNCVGCHKEVNIKAGDPKGRKGPAPTSCTKCHKKMK